jgi:hypothetical protein
MSITLTDLLAQHWTDYAFRHRAQLCGAHYRAVRAVLQCRTPALGGRMYRCDDCHKPHFAYHSCNHRSCPQCGAYDQQVWTAKQEARLLPVPYFMVTFTIPSELWSVCKKYPKELYSILIKQSAQALKDVMQTKTKGGAAGFTSILHTWGRKLQHHPHVHCIVPALALRACTPSRSSAGACTPSRSSAGACTPSRSSAGACTPSRSSAGACTPSRSSAGLGEPIVRPAKDKFLIHYRPLSVRFRSLFQAALRKDHPDIYDALTIEQKCSFSPKKQWNVQLQHVGQGKTALRYLARYVCRSGFTNKRLIGYDKSGKNILLKYTPSGTKTTKILKLSIDEFIRRWLTHILPKGFLRIRHYGFLSSAAKKKRLKIWHHLGALEPAPVLPEKEPFCCPHCDGALQYLRDIPRPQFTRAP